MTVDARLQSLLNELGQHIGIGDLQLDDDAYCALQFDADIVIHFQYGADEQKLVLYADLGAPSSGKHIYQTLLEANFFWQMTAGATLSLSDNEPQHVFIALQQDWQSQNAVDLAASLEQFVNTIEDWRKLIQAESGAEFDKTVAEDTPSQQALTISDNSAIRV